MRYRAVSAALASQTLTPPLPSAIGRLCLGLARVASVRPTAQRLQVVVIVASALLKRYAMIDFVVCSHDPAALTGKSITLQYASTCSHPRITTNPRRCSSFRLQHLNTRSGQRLDPAGELS